MESSSRKNELETKQKLRILKRDQVDRYMIFFFSRKYIGLNHWQFFAVTDTIMPFTVERQGVSLKLMTLMQAIIETGGSLKAL